MSNEQREPRPEPLHGEAWNGAGGAAAGKWHGGPRSDDTGGNGPVVVPDLEIFSSRDENVLGLVVIARAPDGTTDCRLASRQLTHEAFADTLEHCAAQLREQAGK